MKKIIGIMVMLLVFVLSANILNAVEERKTLTKTWTVNHGLGVCIAHWAWIRVDQWGGDNYQCQPGPPAECETWSWKAIYDLELVEPDPCPQNNNVNYGSVIIKSETPADSLPDPLEVDFSIDSTIH